MTTRPLLVAAALFSVALPAPAQTWPWQARIGLSAVRPHDRSSVELGQTSALDVKSGTGIQLGLVYQFATRWAVELSYDRSRFDLDVTSQGTPVMKAGNSTLAVTSLALEYRYFTVSRVHPYLGVGAHLAELAGFSASADLLSAGFSGISFGRSASVTLLAGLDVDVTDRISVTTSLRFHDFATDATPKLQTGTSWQSLRVDVDPWVLAVGAGYRF
jgi:outer membrane protein W